MNNNEWRLSNNIGIDEIQPIDGRADLLRLSDNGHLINIVFLIIGIIILILLIIHKDKNTLKKTIILTIISLIIIIFGCPIMTFLLGIESMTWKEAKIIDWMPIIIPNIIVLIIQIVSFIINIKSFIKKIEEKEENPNV